jgi:hypothetical protein
MRTPFLREPLPAPWWAFFYTLHHKLWCELHFGPAWYRQLYKRTQYNTEGGIFLWGIFVLTMYFLLFVLLSFLAWLLLW